MDSKFTNMLVSIIIPTYKPGNYIVDCLKSLSNQTLSSSSFEVIIVLNGSKSPYQEFLNKYIHNEMQNMNVSFVQVDKPGVSNARNIALQMARGKYICFLDDDDVLSSNYLENSLKIAQEDAIAVSNVEFFVNKIGDVDREHPTAKVYKKCAEKKCATLFQMRIFLSNACYKIIPYSIIKGITFNTAFQMGEDALFMFSISNNIKQIKIVDAIYYRRIREGSAMHIRRSLHFKLVNALNLSYAYVKVYMKHPLQYNFWIFLSRLIATLMNLFR